MHENKTTVNKSVLKISLQSYSSKNLIIPLLVSFLCSLSPSSQKTDTRSPNYQHIIRVFNI